MDLKEILLLKQKLANNWQLTHNSTRLNKLVHFKNFKKPFNLLIQIGNLAEELKHHPDMKLGWGYLEIEITTHSLQSLTVQDFNLASKIDDLMNEGGSVD
jgi:4a-hydroxytetrahydrobiopterin dehydratase